MAEAIAKLDVANMELMVGVELNQVIENFVIDLEAGIQRMQLSGMSDDAIRTVLAEDLANQGRTFSQLKNGFKGAVNAGITNASRGATDKVYLDSGIVQYAWITISAKPCPDCLPRHGRVETLEFWESVGEPASGFSVCQTSCKCELVPVAYKNEALDSALIWTAPDKR